MEVLQRDHGEAEVVRRGYRPWGTKHLDGDGRGTGEWAGAGVPLGCHEGGSVQDSGGRRDPAAAAEREAGLGEEDQEVPGRDRREEAGEAVLRTDLHQRRDHSRPSGNRTSPRKAVHPDRTLLDHGSLLRGHGDLCLGRDHRTRPKRRPRGDGPDRARRVSRAGG